MKRSVSFNIKPAVRLFRRISQSSPTLSAIKEEENTVPALDVSSIMPLAIGMNTAPDEVLHYDGRSWSYVKKSGCHAETEPADWPLCMETNIFTEAIGGCSNTWEQPTPCCTSEGDMPPLMPHLYQGRAQPMPPPPLNLGTIDGSIPLRINVPNLFPEQEPPPPLNLGTIDGSIPLRINVPNLFPEQEPPPTPIYYDNSPLSPSSHYIISQMREEEVAVRKEALASAVISEN